MFNSILNPIFGPLLNMNPLLALILISFLISLLITIVTKYFTNQELMKRLKAEMKDYQKQMKVEKANPDKMMALQKKAMKKNMEYMKQSMRSTLITFIPIILVFGWLNANMAFLPIQPDTEFDVTVSFAKGTTGEIELTAPDAVSILSDNPVHIEDNKAIWTLQGQETDALLQFYYNERYFDTDLIITKGNEYAPVVKKVKDPNLKTITLGNEKLKPMNLFGWKVGWLGTYIIFSIIFSMGMRKLMKLH